MRRYEVQCVDRVTGAETPVLVDASSLDAARAWAISEGHMVGRVTDVGPADADASHEVTSSHAGVEDPQAARERQAMIDAARQWQRQRAAGSVGVGSSGGAVDTQRLAASLDAIASSPIVTHPRRTLFIAIVLASVVTSTISQIIILGFQVVFGGVASGVLRAPSALSIPSDAPASASASPGEQPMDPRIAAILEQMKAQAGSGGAPGAPTASPEAVDAAKKQIEAIRKLYEDTANNPMGDK